MTNSSISESGSEWIWSDKFVTTILLTLMSLYVFIALFYHQINVEKPQRIRLFQLPLAKRYGVMPKYTCIFIAGASLLLNILKISSHLIMVSHPVFSNKSMLRPSAGAALCNVYPNI